MTDLERVAQRIRDKAERIHPSWPGYEVMLRVLQRADQQLDCELWDAHKRGDVDRLGAPT